MKKKEIILAVTAVLAVISLTYGIMAPPHHKGAHESPRPAESVSATVTPVHGHSAMRGIRTSFKDWAANPFRNKIELKKQAMELKLTGIIYDGEKSEVIINDEILRVGDAIGELTVSEIRSNSVIVSDGDKKTELHF